MSFGTKIRVRESKDQKQKSSINKPEQTESQSISSKSEQQIQQIQQQKQQLQSLQQQQQAQQQKSLKQEKEDELKEFEQKKQKSNIGVELSESMVKNSLGHNVKVKDIDPYWTTNEPIQILSFLPSDNTNDNNASADEVLLMLNADISKLLKMRYNVFWSHILLNNTISDFIESFLRFVDRPYQHINLCSANSSKVLGTREFQDSRRLLEQRVLNLLSRMSLQQEKNGMFIGRDYYAKTVIHEKSLFDIPKIIDLCAVYANRSYSEVKAIVNRLFDVQPRLYDELVNVVNVISRSLSELNQSIIQINNIDLLKIEDSSSLLLDIVYSVDCLMKVFPFSVHAFEDNDSFLPLLVYYYEKIIPIFEQSAGSQLKSQFVPLKTHILSIVHCIIKHCYSNKIDQISSLLSEPCTVCSKKSKGEPKLTYTELSKRFFGLLGRLNENKEFDKSKRSKQFNTYFETVHIASILYDYEEKSSLSVRLVELYNLDKDMDKTILAYYMNMMGKELPKDRQQTTAKKQEPVKSPFDNKPTSQKDITNIQNVKDIFPDFGDKFIYKCLRYYNDNVESTINAMFEESLPSHLKSSNRSEQFAAAAPSSSNEQSSSSPQISTTSTTTNNNPTTSTTTATTTTTNKNNNDVNNLTKDVYEMTIGKKSSDVVPNLSAIKHYITNYEVMYDDEYDDSLDVFLGVSVQDGESLDDEEDEEKKKPAMPSEPLTKKPYGNKGYVNHHKNHHRKDKALKKQMIPNQSTH